MAKNKILVTGTAGFIGFHLVNSLIRLGHEIIGIDNINDYYDVKLKFDRLNYVGINGSEIVWHKRIFSKLFPNYSFIRMNLEDTKEIINLCINEKFDYIIHLAAQAGVRYSIENPNAYIQSNLVGFGNILEGARACKVKHLLYASSSSVYGLNKKIPFATDDNVDYPISLYAATKKANELMAHTYSHLYQIPSTGLRFFTVYGPWGRPDMAYFSFSENIVNNKEITVFNYGEMKRDFTYISDIVDGIMSVIFLEPKPLIMEEGGEKYTNAPYRVINLGNNKPIKLLDFIRTLEKSLSLKANIKFTNLQDGDVLETWADINLTKKVFSYEPKVEIREGLDKFANWFKKYYKYEN